MKKALGGQIWVPVHIPPQNKGRQTNPYDKTRFIFTFTVLMLISLLPVAYLMNRWVFNPDLVVENQISYLKPNMSSPLIWALFLFMFLTIGCANYFIIGLLADRTYRSMFSLKNLPLFQLSISSILAIFIIGVVASNIWSLSFGSQITIKSPETGREYFVLPPHTQNGDISTFGYDKKTNEEIALKVETAGVSGHLSTKIITTYTIDYLPWLQDDLSSMEKVEVYESSDGKLIKVSPDGKRTPFSE